MPEIPDGQNPNPQKRPGNPLLPYMIAFVVFDTLALGGFLAWNFTRPQPQPSTPGAISAPPTVQKPPLPSPPKTSASPIPKTNSYTLFVPNDNALLSRQTIKDASTPDGATPSQKAKRALELLFPKIDFWPKGARLLSAPVMEKDGVVRVNLSSEFQKLDTHSETEIRLALDAMARTLGALESKNGKPLYSAKMRVVIEGRIVPTLGQFSLDEPWQAQEVEPDSKSEDAV